ncbi:MAG TPA: hypothetical protein VIV11_05665 [Kofleriaceae bacterium]
MIRVGYIVTALTVFALHEAHAADGSARHTLRWTRGPGAEACIDAPALTTAVEARLGYRAFGDAAAAVNIEAHVQAKAPGWHVAIAVRRDDGTALGARELDERSPDCRVLDEALVLMIALIVDPDAAMRASPPTVAPAAPPPIARSSPWLFEASAAIATAGMLLPGASIGAAARVSIDPPGLPVVVIRGTWWLEDELRDRNQGSAMNLVTGGVALRVPVSGDLVAVSGGIELGRMAGAGFGFDRSDHASATVAYLTLEPTISVKLTPRLVFSALVGAWIPLVRPRFVYVEAGETMLLYQPSPVALVGQAGLTVPF